MLFTPRYEAHKRTSMLHLGRIQRLLVMVAALAAIHVAAQSEVNTIAQLAIPRATTTPRMPISSFSGCGPGQLLMPNLQVGSAA